MQINHEICPHRVSVSVSVTSPRNSAVGVGATGTISRIKTYSNGKTVERIGVEISECREKRLTRNMHLVCKGGAMQESISDCVGTDLTPL